MLLAKCHSLRVFVPTFIYSLSLVGMFGVSALYHRPKWNDFQRLLMKRLDHAAIFVLIAGTGTPICMLAMPKADGDKLLLITWAVAFLGIVRSLIWVHAPKGISALLYVIAGWISVTYLKEIETGLGSQLLPFLTLGGAVYSVGALIYAFKWPNPSPTYFGYHEIFHVMVIVGAAFHFLVIQALVV